MADETIGRDERWSARELMLVLGYTKGENFSKAIDRAMLSCDTAGFDERKHFSDNRKMVEMPSKPRKDGINLGFPNLRKTKEIIDYIDYNLKSHFLNLFRHIKYPFFVKMWS